MPTALITSTGSVATDIVLKTLKRLGYRTVGCNIYPKEWVVESCDVDIFHKIPRISDSQEYLEAIKKICLADGVNYVLPMIDYEIDIFNQNREWFKNHGIILCMSPKNTLDIVRNKKALADSLFCCVNRKAFPKRQLLSVRRSLRFLVESMLWKEGSA